MGKRIKDQRIKGKLTQKELSQKLGITPKMISYYENDQRTPPADMIVKIAQLFNISSDYLLGLSDDDLSSFNNFKIVLDKSEKQLIDNFRSLNHDYKCIVTGEIMKCKKMQEQDILLEKKEVSKRQA